MVDGALFQSIRSVTDLALSFFTPPRCRSCDAPLFGRRNPLLCPDCLQQVEWIGDGACRNCGFPAGPHAELGDDCEHCRKRDLRLTGAAAVSRYRHGARDLVLALKFRRETALAKPMATLMTLRYRTVALPDCDIVAPVPLHPARHRERGFDQAGLLARHVAAGLGFALDKNLLVRIRRTHPQSLLKKDGRMENIQNAFCAGKNVNGAKVLLVDDVMTTGATMAECARVCREAGAARVYALVFAR